MISEELYDKLYEKWSNLTGERHIYQAKDRVWKRLLDYEKYVPVLKGKKVLEIGCNAGMHAYMICQVAESYLGLDPSPQYSKHSAITSEYIENKDCVFMKGTIQDLIKIDFDIDAFCANYCLYHVPDNELELIAKYVMPKVKTVVIQNRNQKRPTPHNSYKFWKNKRIVQWLQGQGFSDIEVHDSEETRRNEGKDIPKWSTIIAKR